MANFVDAYSRLSHFAHPANDEMHGTSGNDNFYAGGGDDLIYAGAGNDFVYGGSGNDTIYAAAYQAGGYVEAWGNDTVYGGDGNDHINYVNTTSNVVIYGDNLLAGAQDGNDWIVSGAGKDYIYGGGGNDYIRGGAGNDYIWGDTYGDIGNASGNDTLYGEEGSDHIYGGAGNDVISGGRDVDYMYGGSGADTFMFSAGDTGLRYADADVIYDFKPSSDRGFPGDTIDFVTTEKGTSSNFSHTTIDTSHEYTYAAEYEHALRAANVTEASNSNLKYVFVTDGQDGWLFADTNGDHHLDAGIELRGVTDMHSWNIV